LLLLTVNAIAFRLAYFIIIIIIYLFSKMEKYS